MSFKLEIISNFIFFLFFIYFQNYFLKIRIFCKNQLKFFFFFNKGFSNARFLAERGATVYMVCRNKERGEKAQEDIINTTKNDNINLLICDVSIQKDLRILAENFINSGIEFSIIFWLFFF